MPLKYSNQILILEDFEYLYSEMPNFEAIKSRFAPNKHDIYLFKNKYGFDDSYIFQLGKDNKESENCFGWIFPLSIFEDITSFLQYLEVKAISDLDWSKATDNKIFFLKNFLYPAFRHLILDNQNLSIQNTLKSDYNITDFYDKEAYILIVSKQRFNDLGLKVEYILPNLFSLGFCYLTKKEDSGMVEIIPQSNKLTNQPFSNVAIQVVSQDLKTETYIIELFKNLLKVELHPVMRFYLLYQVIELLINKVGLKKFSDKKADIMQILSQPNPSHYHDVSESMKELSKMSLSEEKRINFLFEENCKLSIDDYNNLNAKSLFSNSYENITGLVYEHRNKLIHGYYKLQAGYPDIDEKLKSFNIEFEKLIIDVVTHYKDV